jgi:5-methylcytosine-specific restriction enzyme subunit McrC
MLHSCFEYESLSFAWNDHHLEALERLNKKLGATVLQATTLRGERVLRASSYVGVVRLGHETIQILPKIEYGTNREQSATRNLLYLLEHVGHFPIRPSDLAPLLQRGQNWFEILTRLLATELKAQWQRGPHRNYQLVEEELPTLKGKWRIDQQLRQPARQHRFTVAYDEFTVDNQLNRIFRLVIERLWQQTRDTGNRRLLSDLRQWLDDVTLLSHLTAYDAQPTLINRLNYQFEPALNLARLFLGGETIEMRLGDLDTFAFVFDMNQLFEAFIVSFIRRYRAEILPPPLQDCTFHPQARQHTRYLARTAAGPVFRLKPDLALRNGDHFPLLLDTKYKRLKATDARLGISQADFYQMFAYAHRYQCPRILLIYPQIETLLRADFQLEGEGASITAVTVNLHRDLSSPSSRQSLKRELRAAFIKEEWTNGSIP